MSCPNCFESSYFYFFWVKPTWLVYISRVIPFICNLIGLFSCQSIILLLMLLQYMLLYFGILSAFSKELLHWFSLLKHSKLLPYRCSAEKTDIYNNCSLSDVCPVCHLIDREWTCRGSCCSYFKEATHASRSRRWKVG